MFLWNRQVYTGSVILWHNPVYQQPLDLTVFYYSSLSLPLLHSLQIHVKIHVKNTLQQKHLFDFVFLIFEACKPQSYSSPKQRPNDWHRLCAIKIFFWAKRYDGENLREVQPVYGLSFEEYSLNFGNIWENSNLSVGSHLGLLRQHRLSFFLCKLQQFCWQKKVKKNTYYFLHLWSNVYGNELFQRSTQFNKI